MEDDGRSSELNESAGPEGGVGSGHGGWVGGVGDLKDELSVTPKAFSNI